MACKGDRRIEDPEGGESRPDPREFFKIFTKNFKFYRIFRKIWTKIYENSKICISRGFRGGAAEASQFIKNLLEQSMETSHIFESCTNSERISFSTMRILIKFEVPLVV